MDKISIITYILFDSIATYSYFLIIDNCMQKKNRRVQGRFLAFFFILNYLAGIFRYTFLIGGDAYQNMLFSILSVFLLCFLYRGSMLRRIFTAALGFCLGGVADVGVGLLIAVASDQNINTLHVSNPWMNALGIALNSSLFFIIALFCAKVCQKRNGSDTGTELSRSYLITFTALPLLSIAVACQFLSAGYNNGVLSVSAIFLCMMLLIAINVLVLYLYQELLKEQAARTRSLLIEQQNLAYAHELSLMEQNSRKIRTLQHDMKNHILSIRQMLQMDEKEELESYLNHFFGELEQEKEYLNTGFPQLDSMVNYKLHQAEAAGARVEATGILPALAPEELDPFDLSAIFGNLLDNALEALERVERKWISVEIKLVKGVFCIDVQNTYDGIVIKSRENQTIYRTRKAKAAGHGLGLSVVKIIAEKYHGMMSIHDENGIFHVRVVLYPKYGQSHPGKEEPHAENCNL